MNLSGSHSPPLAAVSGTVPKEPLREAANTPPLGAGKFISPLLEQARKRTKPRTVDLYEVWCAVLYVLRTGCQWRALPRDFSKWSTVYAYFAKWNAPREGGILLEQALKKSGWRGPRQTGAQRMQHILDRGHAQREEYRHGQAQGV